MQKAEYVIGGQEFYLSPLCERVEEGLYVTVVDILKSLPKDKEAQLLAIDIKKTSLFDIIDFLGLLTIKSQAALYACILCPVGKTEQNKDREKIKEHIQKGMSWITKVTVLRDFSEREQLPFVVANIITLVANFKKNVSEQTKVLSQ